MRTSTLGLFLLIWLPPLTAQLAPALPPELKALAAFEGSWGGSGTANFGPGAPATKWHGVGTYQWVLGGNWLQEDFAITFDGVPMPMVMRSYLGWDRQQQRYVMVSADNHGRVAVRELVRLPDGSFVEMVLQKRDGLPNVERSRLHAVGNSLTHGLEMWRHEGPVVPVTAAEFSRVDANYSCQFDVAPWAGAPVPEAMQKLARAAGTYEVKGTVLPGPLQQKVEIAGVDTFASAFSGMVFLGESNGAPVGQEVAYEGRVLWGYDHDRACITGVYVGSFGELMQNEARWLPSGSLLMTGQAMRGNSTHLERFVLDVDDKGRFTRTTAVTLIDDQPAYESYSATYAFRAAKN